MEAPPELFEPTEERDPVLGLRHYDPSQLWFQVAEIVGKRTYLQHGIELAPGAVVLDVGANVGVAAAFFATEKAGVVHSFEPVRPVYELLRENVRRFPACVPHGFGLAAEAGSAEITFYPGANAMSGLYADRERDSGFVRSRMVEHGVGEREADAEVGRRFTPVASTCELRTLSETMRELSLRQVDLLKIDVERAELDVLLGIDEPTWPRIAQIVCEVHDERGRLERISTMLADRGFVVTADQDEVMHGTAVRMLYAIRR